ncbi:MAG: hypothetical protein R3B93_14220 [Bacteroidia bacterium]
MTNFNDNDKNVNSHHQTPLNDRELSDLLLWYLSYPDPSIEALIMLFLYESTKDLIYRISLKYLKDHDLSQDAVHEIFIHLWKKLQTPGFIIHKSCMGWVNKETFWYCKQFYRKQKEIPFSEMEGYWHPSDNSRPDQGLDESVILACKDHALEGKRRCFRRFIMDARMRGISNPDIAVLWTELTGEETNEKAVRQAYSLTLKDIDEVLKGTGYSRPGNGKGNTPQK